MKKTLLVAGLLTLLIVLTAAMAFAIPTLQLDIAGGTYNPDPTVETIIASTNPFTLYAYLIPNDSNTLTDWYYISMALAPQRDTAGNIGSFSFNTTTIDVTNDMTYGVPPLETYLGDTAVFDSGDLSRHGIFETYFYEYAFQFNAANQISQYNTQDRAQSGGSIPSTGIGMYYVALTVDTALLDPNYVVHFDLYNTALARRSTTDIDVTKFAPYSHDAESNHRIPEPKTILLLGSGLLGIASMGLRRKK